MEFDHVTAIVADSEAVAAALSKLLSVDPIGSVELPGMRVTTFRLGSMELHVNSPSAPGPVAEFLNAKGPSLHHLAVRVANLDVFLDELSRRGMRALGAPIEVAPGLREVFVDPAHTGGILIQLVERTSADVAPQQLRDDAVASVVDRAAKSFDPSDE